MQWPASYCDTKRSCCYPKTGKPAEDFSIHGLWPNYKDGSYPANCDSTNLFNDSEVTTLVPNVPCNIISLNDTKMKFKLWLMTSFLTNYQLSTD